MRPARRSPLPPSTTATSPSVGAGVRFAKTSRILAELAGGHADRTWDKRIRERIRPGLLALDGFALRRLTAPQADDLYDLFSERRNRS
jgi:DNA replication protein DnaC